MEIFQKFDPAEPDGETVAVDDQGLPVAVEPVSWEPLPFHTELFTLRSRGH